MMKTMKNFAMDDVAWLFYLLQDALNNSNNKQLLFTTEASNEVALKVNGKIDLEIRLNCYYIPYKDYNRGFSYVLLL